MTGLELIDFAAKWARIQRNATPDEQAQFASFYLEHYPYGDRALSWVWDYQSWKGSN